MYEFNAQQVEKINKQMKPIMEDIKNIISLSSTCLKDPIYLDFNRLKTNIPGVKLAKWSFACWQYYSCLDVRWDRFNVYNRDWISLGFDDSNWSLHKELVAASVVIENYPRIRRKLIKEIKMQIKNYERENKLNEKASSKIDVMLDKNLDKKIDDSAIIKFRCPDSMNVHELEMREEAGRKVGRIDFGDMVVEIITSGDIVIANKNQDKPKQKLRKKN